ncbi:MAG: hypothetical protein ACLR5B_03220 [Blautia sp.]
MAIPTTLADAPIGVALPPISGSHSKCPCKDGNLNSCAAARLLITGIMAAANEYYQ